MAAISCMLSEHHVVVTAHNLDGAMRLLNRPNSCRLAYYEVGDDADAAREGIHLLGNAGMEVVALFRPPCPQLVCEAAASGRIQGYCQMPICVESFLVQSREIMRRVCPIQNDDRPQPCLLTNEEVQFLLGREVGCKSDPCFRFMD